MVEAGFSVPLGHYSPSQVNRARDSIPPSDFHHSERCHPVLQSKYISVYCLVCLVPLLYRYGIDNYVVAMRTYEISYELVTLSLLLTKNLSK